MFDMLDFEFNRMLLQVSKSTQQHNTKGKNCPKQVNTEKEKNQFAMTQQDLLFAKGQRSTR